MEAQLVESLNSISTIKRFGIEEYANLKTETRFVHLLKNTYRSIYGSIMAQGGIQFVSTGITIAVLWLGSILVVDQELTPGALMVFYSLVGYVISPIGSLISSNQTIQDIFLSLCACIISTAFGSCSRKVSAGISSAFSKCPTSYS